MDICVSRKEELRSKIGRNRKCQVGTALVMVLWFIGFFVTGIWIKPSIATAEWMPNVLVGGVMLVVVVNAVLKFREWALKRKVDGLE
ncbi:hypothetical protein [Bacillus cereus]|uniref:hypothetical protein n=1 Tax=Bacillus cereus TaxID=1396 RepID=UPI000BFBC62B|nr:hypothetical protein [Bacillus cereus]PGR83550.1 hypothetical protein COC63_06080 [Bacillus cereus]